MALRLTPAQAHRVKALVHRRCCNCDDDHCLLPDDRRLYPDADERGKTMVLSRECAVNKQRRK